MGEGFGKSNKGGTWFGENLANTSKEEWVDQFLGEGLAICSFVGPAKSFLSEFIEWDVDQNIQCFGGGGIAVGMTYEIPIFEISESFTMPRNPFTRSINL